MRVMTRTGTVGRKWMSTLSTLIVAGAVLTACTNTPEADSVNGTGSGDRSSGVSPADSAAKVHISVSPAAQTQLDPTQPISVKADQGSLTKVVVRNPGSGKIVDGKFNADKTAWQSTVDLGYGVGYEVEADGSDNDGKTAHEKATVNTIKPQATAYPSLVPAPNTNIIGVGQPIEVIFDHPVDRAVAQKAISVTSSVKQQGSWYWLSDTEAHYRPKEYWQPGSTVNVDYSVYGKKLGDGVYGDADQKASFTVGDSMVAKADGKSETMKIYKNGKYLRSMPISMGKDDTPTHTGVHVISEKNQSVVMDSCTYGVCEGQPGYYKTKEFWALRISNDGEFVHENPASVGSQGNTNVSHGCINLNTENAKWFFSNFGPGDVVEVTNSGGPKLPIDDTYGDWSLSWAEWQKGSAL